MARQKKVTKKERTAPLIIRFSNDDLWVRGEADRVEVGLSDYGQGKLGEIIGVELPEVGSAVERGEPFGELESVRTALELASPVTGTVVAVNTELTENPSLINEDPYHEGWLIEVTLKDEAELEELMEADEYEEFVESESDD
ncbi:MAG: glycine cleavage system protein GcvH [Deltaproteobacteria bacterium]|nr:glycine cleavage system protein GcvH [Deltaproteobacteria bacterium]MBI3387056.1 glycine cleavage system protein GcvH [Deltaproteobacteria bacterium]